MACVFFLYAASGLLAPWWVVVLLLRRVGVLLFVASRWWSLHPTWVPWLPVFAAVLWFVALNAGGRLARLDRLSAAGDCLAARPAGSSRRRCRWSVVISRAPLGADA